MLAGRPFGYKLDGRRIGRELKFVPIRQFANAGCESAQLRSQLIEMALSFDGVQRRAVTSEGRNGGGGQGKD